MGDLLRYNLGGCGKDPGRITVNLRAPADIIADIVNLDSFCKDGAADEFFMSHTLEHVPLEFYLAFLTGLWKKLKPGGVLWVIQSDAGAVIDMWKRGEIRFRSMRTVLFTPAHRVRENPLQRHHNMWSQYEMCRDLQKIGFIVHSMPVQPWSYDHDDELFPGDTSADHGKLIPNLSVQAVRPLR